MEESEQIIRILCSRREDDRSLVDLIRNGAWDADFFEQVTIELKSMPQRIPDPLSPEALNYVFTIILAAYFASPKWAYPIRSPERVALGHLVSAIWALADKWIITQTSLRNMHGQDASALPNYPTDASEGRRADRDPPLSVKRSLP